MPDIQPLLELAVSDRDITLLKNACVKLDTTVSYTHLTLPTSHCV